MCTACFLCWLDSRAFIPSVLSPCVFVFSRWWWLVKWRCFGDIFIKYTNIYGWLLQRQSLSLLGHCKSFAQPFRLYDNKFQIIPTYLHCKLHIKLYWGKVKIFLFMFIQGYCLTMKTNWSWRAATEVTPKSPVQRENLKNALGIGRNGKPQIQAHRGSVRASVLGLPN